MFQLEGCFRNQEMEYRVVRSGYSAPQGQLGVWSDAHKLKRLRKQIILVRHLYPVWIAAAVLLGLTSEVEIRPQAPIFNRSYRIEKCCCDPASKVGNSIFAYICIGKQDAEE